MVECRNVTKVYGSGEAAVTALRDVSISVPEGSFTAIMGASGSGKSTLMHLIGGLTLPTQGEVHVEGRNLGALSDKARTIFRRRRLGVIFQDYNLLPTLTAAENVALPLVVDGVEIAANDARVLDLLDRVHLRDRAGHRPDALSGGERQRVAIARALLNDPAILLADEPTGNLDSKQSREIWGLLRGISSDQNKTTLMITHEAAAAAFADRVLIFKDGAVVGEMHPGDADDVAGVTEAYQRLAG